MNNFTIPNTKSPLIDKSTGLVSRDWFIYLSNLLAAVGQGVIGTTTQVLHGGGGGYSAVSLTQDISGILAGANGGTGVANTAKTITLDGNFTTSGSFPVVISVTASTTVVFPTSGTLAALSDIGSMGFQNAGSVNVTGGTVSNVTVQAVRLITLSSITVSNIAITTGTTTATFVAVNKPGVSTTTPDKWIPIIIDGTPRYIPCWP